MINGTWPKALKEACLHAYHPAFLQDAPEHIVMRFLWRWGNYPLHLWSQWECTFNQGRDEDERFVHDIFSILQKILTEGDEASRLFALFLLGGWTNPQAKDLLITFLHSPLPRERWASIISLGRHKEESIFAQLKTLLLDGFAAEDIFENEKALQAAQSACRLYRQKSNEEEQATLSESYMLIIDRLRDIHYEWYQYQRAEVALVLGTWENPTAISILQEALEATWKMELAWPDYEGPDEVGPEFWYFFQDCLAFALGQLEAGDSLIPLSFPKYHLQVARIYFVLGSLRIRDERIFLRHQISSLFHTDQTTLLMKSAMEQAGLEAEPFIEPELVKTLLAKYFSLSPREQDEYLAHFPRAWDMRASESNAVLLIPQSIRYPNF